MRETLARSAYVRALAALAFLILLGLLASLARGVSSDVVAPRSVGLRRTIG